VSKRRTDVVCEATILLQGQPAINQKKRRKGGRKAHDHGVQDLLSRLKDLTIFRLPIGRGPLSFNSGKELRGGLFTKKRIQG